LQAYEFYTIKCISRKIKTIDMYGMLRKWKPLLDTRIIAERDRFEVANVEQKSSKFYVHVPCILVILVI